MGSVDSTFDSSLPSRLAERMRPTNLSRYVGQSDVVGPGSLLGSMLENLDQTTPSSSKSEHSGSKMNTEASASLGSIIFWGPPGSGKTTLARLIAGRIEADFRELSATRHVLLVQSRHCVMADCLSRSSGAADVRKVFEQAKNQLRLTGR